MKITAFKNSLKVGGVVQILNVTFFKGPRGFHAMSERLTIKENIDLG